jgi:hypothetical protein
MVFGLDLRTGFTHEHSGNGRRRADDFSLAAMSLPARRAASHQKYPAIRIISVAHPVAAHAVSTYPPP